MAFEIPRTFAPCKRDSPWILNISHLPLSEGLLGRDAKQSKEQILWPLASLVLTEMMSMVHVLCVRACVRCVHACVCAHTCAPEFAEFLSLSKCEPDLEVPVFPSMLLFHT